MKTKGTKESKVRVITMGCSKNLVDSENIITQLQGNQINAEHEDLQGDADVVIVNTCGFIESAKQESINTILGQIQLKEEGGIDKLYVTGCLSERYKNELALEMPEVDAYFGTMELPALLSRFGADYQHELIGDRAIVTPPHFAYLKISEGCNRTCSFCAIPLMRGKHRSKPIEELVREAENLAARGVKEIILIAQELTYYGLDIYRKRMLPELLRLLSRVEGIEWIRLHYSYPSKFPMDILEVMAAEEKICNYLDIPLQHISDPVLFRMKRQIDQKTTRKLIEDIRSVVPGIALRTTFMVGFPGETDEDFNYLKDFVQEVRFDRMGVFTYSHEEGTGAFNLKDNVSSALKDKRAQELMQTQEGISELKNQELVGKKMKVLIDRKEGQYFIGRTEFDSPEVDNEVLVEAQNHFLRIGDFAQLMITDANAFDLFGVPVSHNG